ncbi:MAG: M20/M25/M40 family metallo-hydrolase [Clostridia bacterium]|nr:M20/M25/M40 family metallo-hydrolase [Clostridia bacterium]
MLHPDYQNDTAVRALRLAIMQPTISGDDAGSFQRLHTLLRQLFPLVFSHGSCETVDGGALLIHLPGRQHARSMVFCAHLDVVSAGDPGRWTHPPFSGTVWDGYIYGRGAADMKGHLIALLCAAEGLLQEGWQPAGDIWFAFSCDEETRGGSMRSMARILKSRGVQPAFVLDEGGNVSHPYTLAREDAAYVGVCEKGRLLFSLSCEGINAMETLARAAVRVARIRPEYRLCAPVLEVMLPAMKPILSREARLFLRYPRVFGRGLLLRLRQTATGRAITQTQLSLWKQNGDALMREVPTLHYSASVLPGDETQKLLGRVKRMLARTPIALHVTVLEEPGQVSPARGLSWDALATAIQVHFPGVRIVPCLLAGGTDSRHMECICPNVYRFSPFILPPEELARTHHYDERLSIENLHRGVSFFRQMLQA